MKRPSIIGLTVAALSAGARLPAFAQCGIASNYSTGAITANGERFKAQGLNVLSYGGEASRLRRAAFHGKQGLKQRLARTRD